jgi:hypothetical protein
MNCEDLPQFLLELPCPIGFAESDLGRAEIMKII